MQRTFIALKVEPGNEMMACIEHLKELLKAERMKWVDTGNLHITLRFLGDTNPRQVSLTTRILKDLVPSFEAPEVVFGGLGIFRNLRDPRVLWIGMDPGSTLIRLRKQLDQRLIEPGFSADEKKFRPHLTLARIKSIRRKDVLEQQLKEYSNTEFQRDRIEKIIYYESILRPEGPTYLSLADTPFKYAPS